MTTTTKAVGAPLARIEGPEKVSGRARYAAEYPVDGVAHGWIVPSPVPRGRLTAVVADPAADTIAVLWHGNAPSLAAVDDPELAVLQSDRISYRGQPIALVVADTLEAARRAAQVLHLEIEAEEHETVLRADHPGVYEPETVNPGYPAATVHGDVEKALATADVTVDVTYSTPALHNNPMEPHATIARWDGDDLTLYDSNQHPSGVAATVGEIFGVDRVHVITEHVGGGFGSKGTARPNAVLAALAARVTGRPVKVVLPRQAMFSMVGHRTPTAQRVRLAAGRDGTLSGIDHQAYSQTSRLYEFAEQTAVVTRHMYAAPHRRTGHHLLRLDMPTPRWMRAPGEAPGMLALECAIDELAEKLGMDPIELRIRNEPSVEPESGVAFTSRHYVECLRRGGGAFRLVRPRSPAGAAARGRLVDRHRGGRSDVPDDGTAVDRPGAGAAGRDVRGGDRRDRPGDRCPHDPGADRRRRPGRGAGAGADADRRQHPAAGIRRGRLLRQRVVGLGGHRGVPFPARHRA
jgi:xanthine dehydrogenase YagR molybdenum-binding subunit